MHHHSFGSSKGDALCPLGFHPQVRWPTRCKRCFRDYKDHAGKRTPGLQASITSSTPSLSKWESSPGRSSDSSETKRTWASTSNLSKDEPSKANTLPAEEWSNSAVDISSRDIQISGNRPRSYVGSASDTVASFRRHSVDETALFANDRSEEKPQTLQIRQVIDKSSSGSENDVAFIVQVSKTKQNSESGLEKAGGATEIERLKGQLAEMKARCERVEREKGEILLRRLATMDSVSSKTAKNSEVSRLQKSVKELQAKNEALSDEKVTLLTKIKSLERETSAKNSGNRGERDKSTTEDLKSKLKAAETLCENLMDENEDMKKEIRELEEEIYEMQDNFREEQADEYTNLRKKLEQSNKNCRILSFKLRKIERKAEQLETEKTDVETKYHGVKSMEENLKRLATDLKAKGLGKSTGYTTNAQLKKMMEDMEKDLSNIFGGTNAIPTGNNVPNMSEQDSSKYEQLYKDHEILQAKLDKALKSLAASKDTAKPSETNKTEIQNLKKKLNETTAARETDRKSWETEKVKLDEEKENLKSKLLSLSAEKLKVYNEVLELKKDLQAAKSTEKNNIKIETSLNELKRDLNTERDRCKKLQEELSMSSERESKMSKNLASVEQAKGTAEGELKRVKSEFENSKSSMAMKIAKLTAEIMDVARDRDKWKAQLEEDKAAKDTEVGSLRKKMAALEKAESNVKKMNEMKQNYSEKITILEEELQKGQQLYDELQLKHANLQDDKKKIESEKEAFHKKLAEYQVKLEMTKERLESSEKLQKSKEDHWNEDRRRLQEQLKEREKPSVTNIHLEESREEVSRLTKQAESLKIQLDDMKRMNDDLAGKLNDYNAVTKIQRNLSADTSALDQELRNTKASLANVEKARKTDLAQCKMRYENRIKAINDEIQSIQNQLSRYKRERDTYKHMLEGAQRTIGELKAARQRRQSTTSTGKSDEDEESTGTNVSTLERQISLMEDELSESKLEASKLKTELISERSAWQIKLSELQSRVNELEEDRILVSGRTKIPGLKARIELAWQKEREEQQKLLQETATLARDLRQTLYEVERERDKERLENKRRQEQIQKIYEEEKEETKKKLIELQCDLLELRDAHAKLRTSNEKMRREKERHEREREELKDIIASKRRLEQSEARNMNILLRQVDDLMKLFPELSGKVESSKVPDTYTPTPPRRTKGPKSRESSPMLDGKDDNFKGSSNNVNVGRTDKLECTIKKLMDVAKEMNEAKRSMESESASRKKLGKRASSIDNDSGHGSSSSRSKASLKRKSLSLEQTSGKNDQAIWGTDSNLSSMASLDSDADSRRFGNQRDSSVDSRLSGGSTKSEMLHRDKKHNKNLIRKITTKLTKSASMDDPNSSYDFSLQTSGSEASIIEDSHKTEKKNLKKKLSDMFKRSSKSNGLDKKAQEGSRPPSRSSNA
ncbi:trichohyalin-like isoform X2 [Diachasmimorpha longicaudata]|uniref:trichohyalin-like isoform X2 n=1 Tax=Diachasmimorpha longicaudata TaxID=58733 RepID=UPI0030B91884